MTVFLDSNVLLDIFSQDKAWARWSEEQLLRHSGAGLAVNGVVYAEISVGFRRQSDLDAHLAAFGIRLLEIPRAALFAAGKAFAAYRRQSTLRATILPDFIIGAHSDDLGIPLVTRDVRRFRTYFPNLVLIAPET